MSTNEAKATVNGYVTLLKSQGISVTQAILFGSQAKGTAEKWSDIDTCIVSPDFGSNRFDERLKLLRFTHEPYDMIEPHPFSPQGLQDKYDPLATEIRNTGITVYSE
jgi:predicted nucleotidyltransferase